MLRRGKLGICMQVESWGWPWICLSFGKLIAKTVSKREHPALFTAEAVTHPNRKQQWFPHLRMKMMTGAMMTTMMTMMTMMPMMMTLTMISSRSAPAAPEPAP